MGKYSFLLKFKLCWFQSQKHVGSGYSFSFMLSPNEDNYIFSQGYCKDSLDNILVAQQIASYVLFFYDSYLK